MKRVSPALRAQQLKSAHPRQDAQRRLAAYDAQVKAIRQDANLSEQGKRRDLAELYVQQKQTSAELRSIEDRQRADRLRELDRVIYGGPSSDPGEIISARDAADRADALESPADARRLLARADRTGDKLLASAVARRASEAGWRQVLADYAASRPRAREALDELRQLQGDPLSAQSRARAIEDRIVREATYGGAARPAELAGMSDAAAAHLATDPEPPAEPNTLAKWAKAGFFKADGDTGGMAHIPEELG